MKELYLWGLLIHLFSCHFILGIFNVFLGFSVFPMWILFCLVVLPSLWNLLRARTPSPYSACPPEPFSLPSGGHSCVPKLPSQDLTALLPPLGLLVLAFSGNYSSKKILKRKVIRARCQFPDWLSLWVYKEQNLGEGLKTSTTFQGSGFDLTLKTKGAVRGSLAGNDLFRWAH